MLVEQLPPESQDMAAAAIEMGAGMKEAEVAELIAGFQSSAEKTGSPDEQAKAARDAYFNVALKTRSFSELRRESG